MMVEKDFWHKILDRINRPAIFPLKTQATYRDKPYRAEVHHEPDGQKVSVSLPCARQWWIFAPYLFLVLACPPILFTTVSMGVGLNYRTGSMYWNPLPFFIALAVCLVVLFLLLRIAYPRIMIVGTTEGVTVGKYKFDWDKADGLRLGYTAGQREISHEHFGYTAFRMGYGPWGFELPYMAANYFAPAYIVWVNMMLQTVRHVPDAERINNAEEGFKKDLF